MSQYIILRRRSASIGAGVANRLKFETLGAAGENTEWGLSIEQAEPKQAAQFANDPDVDLVARTMPTALIRPVDMATYAPLAATKPGAAWGIEYVGAHRSGMNGEGITIAVLDTGIDRTHPAFKGVDVVEKDFSGSGNGDRQGHGTHCAGTIFGRDVNGVRIGVARGVQRALIGKVLDDEGAGESEMVFQGLLWALREHADIISMSLGFDFPGLVRRLTQAKWPLELATSTALESYRNNLRMFDAIMNVLHANKNFGKEPLVVAAAGNESQRETNPSFKIAASLPAAAMNVMSVAAIDQAGSIAKFSNTHAALSAPGVDILSAWPGNQFHSISGTSMACPHVAGLAALWWQFQRQQGTTANATIVKSLLLASLERERLGPEFDETDFGLGLAVAPS